MDFRERGSGDVSWIHPAQDMIQWQALVNSVMNLRAPEKTGNFLTSRATISPSIK
jgi:hypothetical protein